MNVYLDSAATTPILPEVKEYIIKILDDYGNPSSIHSIGNTARNIIKKSRIEVAKFINSNYNNVFFTSSGSASNTLAIEGYATTHDVKILYSPIMHKSALKCIQNFKNNESLKVDNNGLIKYDHLKSLLIENIGHAFVVLDYANSEIGTIQDVKKIIDLTHNYGGVVYLDCTGSISTIPLDVSFLDVDMCGFSGHKIGALKGCGVLYKKDNINLKPIVYGNQEDGLIGGTENVIGIASIGKAVEHIDYLNKSSINRDHVYNYLINNIPDCYLVGSKEHRLKNNLYMCFKGVLGEALMLMLDLNGIQISTGSACNSENLTPSPTLLAINMNTEDFNNCIRLSFSGNETSKEIDYVCMKIEECVKELRRFAP